MFRAGLFHIGPIAYRKFASHFLAGEWPEMPMR
jgi:hypothetical protein